MTIDADHLTRTAFDILVEDLTGYGNVLSEMHRAALLELVDTFTGYCTGTRKGRVAFPLPTGLGKTSAIVAFLAALHRLDYRVPVSVAASKVEALCRMKRELLDHGIPAEWVGLKHSLPTASEPSTDNESRLFQLVSHARVRSGRDFELFGMHDGASRALCVYDETFLRADAFSFGARRLYAAEAVLPVVAVDSLNPLRDQLVAYVTTATASIRAALSDLQASGDQHRNGKALELPELDRGTLAAFAGLVDRYSSDLQGFAGVLHSFLDLSQGSLRVIGTEQGEGVVTAREAVPPSLRNVVILDASAPIRELVSLDPTVSVSDSFDAALLKDFNKVQIHQLVSPGGRRAISQSFGKERREGAAVALETARIIREGWETEEAFLVFTFVGRDKLDIAKEMQRDLARAGIDIDATTAAGKPKLNWLTWGSETSLNGLEYCTSVIMAGVLHRSHLDLAAAVRGQTGNPAEPTPSSFIRELIESEIAHCIYQGASRGSCRRIVDGVAVPMRLWFIHRSPTIRAVLDRVMPGAVWTYPEPEHLKKATADSRAAQLLGQLVGYLRGLPPAVESQSTRKIKEAMGLPQDAGTRVAFTRALDLLDPDDHGWSLVERTLVRTASAYGFQDHS